MRRLFVLAAAACFAVAVPALAAPLDVHGAGLEDAIVKRHSGGVAVAPSTIDVDLPDLDGDSDPDIVQDNVNAVAAIDFAYELEAMKLFAVADRIVAQFEAGQIPVCDPCRHHRPAKLPAKQRALAYANAAGAELTTLIGRLYAAIVAGGPQRTARAQKAARDLGVYASAHGAGAGRYLGHALHAETAGAIAIVTDPNVRAAYGARDPWDLVARVSAQLGGGFDVARGRALAAGSATALQWVAAYAPLLRGSHEPAKLAHAIDDASFALSATGEAWLKAAGRDARAIAQTLDAAAPAKWSHAALTPLCFEAPAKLVDCRVRWVKRPSR